MAERTGVPIADLYDRALLDVLARDFAELMRDLAARQADSGDTLSDTEGLAVAHEELRATRADRRNAR